MNRFILGAALLALVATPLVTAHDFNSNGNCKAVGDDTLDIVGIPLAAVTPVGTLYVTDGPGVWTESNGLDGLQTHAHTCRTSPRADPITVGPDTQTL